VTRVLRPTISDIDFVWVSDDDSIFPFRCRHCQEFASSYSTIAATFHSAPDEKIRVAKVDASVEKALATRFGAQSYPSFFLVDGWSVYEFKEHRNEANLISFARGGYKKQQVSAEKKERRVILILNTARG
jgi:thioredoxin-like negative regulator of GroEL